MKVKTINIIISKINTIYYLNDFCISDWYYADDNDYQIVIFWSSSYADDNRYWTYVCK